MTTPIKTPEQFHNACADIMDALASPSEGITPDQGETKVVAAVAAGSVRARIEQRMAFASGCEMHLSQIKVRQRGARHFIRRQEFDAAQKELTVLIEAASALKQHLTQWWGDSDAERGPNSGSQTQPPKTNQL